MNNNEYNNYEEDQLNDSSDSSSESQEGNTTDNNNDIFKAPFAVAITIAGILGIDAWISRRALKKEREKNKLFQEALKKHQAEINALKKAKKRREYMDKLWEEIKSKSEE
jgi:hypothetical protein